MSSREKDVIREILKKVGEMAGSKAEYVPTKGRHSKVRVEILGTFQEFPIPTKEFRSGSVKNNFYSQMNRKISERIVAVKARQSILA